MRKIWTKIKRYISPAFVMCFLAAFILWYIAKLNYNYTTEQKVNVVVDGERIAVRCVVEGSGANLLGYQLNWSKRLRIPLSELRYELSADSEDSIVIDAESLRSALSLRMNDIKITAVTDVPEIPAPTPKTQKQ